MREPRAMSAALGGAALPASAAPRRTSDVLSALAAEHAGERITIGDIVRGLGDRAFGMLLFAFAAPNLPPLGIPGLSSVCAVPLLMLALQLMAGRAEPALPSWVTARSIPTVAFRRLVAFVVPWLARAERLVRPRAAIAVSGAGERAAGAVIAVLAFVLVLPIPFGNLLPAIAIALFALAIVERDGLAALAGHVAAVVSLAVVAGVVIGSAELAMAAWRFLFDA
jgi:hypothetical protein